MKYLFYELYEKVCYPGGEVYEKEWNKQYKMYMDEFHQLFSRLPKTFLAEYVRCGMHDNIFDNLTIIKRELKTYCKYDLRLRFQDYHQKKIVHDMVFTDINHFRTNLCFGAFSGSCDWIYSEILPIDDKRMSFEAILFDDSTVYFEFSKLHYKKFKE